VDVKKMMMKGSLGRLQNEAFIAEFKDANIKKHLKHEHWLRKLDSMRKGAPWTNRGYPTYYSHHCALTMVPADSSFFNCSSLFVLLLLL